MDDSERDRFYTAPRDDWDDDGVEYEVEPPDAEVIALEKRRAQEVVAESEMSIDVDEIYREMEGRDTIGLPFKLPKDFRFQFQVKHLLIATAVLAVLLTMWRLHILANIVGVLFLSAVGGTLAYAELQEQRRLMEAERRWQAKYQRRREYFERPPHERQRKPGEAATIYDDVPFDGRALAAAAPPTETKFHFQFSLRQFFLVMTLAAVSLGMVHFIGSSGIVAMLLGIIAFGGLIVHAIGVQPPQFVVLGWWLVLALYIVMGIASEIQNAF